jgi:hypothetical protein
MKAIRERRCTNVPFADAPAYLDQYIHDVVADGGGRIVLSVAVPIERLGIDRRIEVSRMVSVRFEKPGDPDLAAQLTGVSWAPDKGGPYPQFTGAIRLDPDEDPDRCCLMLEGEYDPPFGIVGDAFDALIGKHIARTTIRNLLDEIAIIMETSYESSRVSVASLN